MRKTLLRFRPVMLAAASLGLYSLGPTCFVPGQENPAATQKASEKSLKLFLQETLERDEATRYVAALWDLDGDGTPEAIVYLSGDGWCGSGGCTTLVLKREGDSWKVVGRTTITRPPIYVLANSSHSWRSIGVWVQGGGILRGYEAELPFNGRAYASNPTLPPARRLEGKPTGELVIAAGREGALLYDGGH